MKDYGKTILNALLDKFERSKLAFLENEELASSSSPKISISVSNDKLFAEYWAQDCYQYRPDIDRAVRELCDKGFCYARWDESNGLLERVGLCLDKVDEAFSYMGRTRRQDKDRKEIEMLERKKLESHGGTVRNLLAELKVLANSHKSHMDWYDSEEDLDLFLKMVDAVEMQEDEILLRNFSKRYFSDSKVFEKNQARILKTFNRFGVAEDRYSDFDSLCKEHNIVRNEGFLLVKGKLILDIAGQTFDLSRYPYVFAIPHKAFENLTITDVFSSRLITVENLTTFNYFNEDDAIVVYLGGFAGRHEVEFLKKVCKRTDALDFLHMGDIDWGGFQILMDLRKKTGMSFKALHMGIGELERYRQQCSPLTERDKVGLSKLLNDKDAADFWDTIAFMLDNGYKMEQESLVF